MNNNQKLFLLFSILQLSIILFIDPQYYTANVIGSADVQVTSVLAEDNNSRPIALYVSIIFLILLLVSVVVRIYFLVRKLRKRH
ncbi:MAG TPA: hypothetical protein HA226_02085 [Nanoarchaeota archaeon]|nr:MAG: hypothetical protein QT09_C0010G0040 [archaeon GW2011_AR18]HIH25540.1 hypothetical protein [Nanoarchaeota archaeon]